jgi:hypothetical protein
VPFKRWLVCLISPLVPRHLLLCVGLEGEQLATALSGILPLEEGDAAAAAAAAAADGEDSGATRDQKVGRLRITAHLVHNIVALLTEEIADCGRYSSITCLF